MSVNREKCKEVFGGIDGMYWSMVRSKFYLPKRKSNIINE